MPCRLGEAESEGLLEMTDPIELKYQFLKQLLQNLEIAA
jgi:hypothetical protein